VDFADELKMVVDDNLTIDILLRGEFLKLIEEKKLILQPEGNKEKFVKKSLELIDILLSQNLYGRLIPQVHKLINLP
jgi:organic radical activating enzyme